ncbi:MAG: tetratricopeptide repeat protein [Sphingomonadales bacterium]
MPAAPRLTLLLAALLATQAQAARTITQPPESPLHAYVLGRYAAADDDVALASRFFDAARQQQPNAMLDRKAFDLAVAAGNRDDAIALARAIALAGKGDADTGLVLLAAAVQGRDARADKAITAARTALAGAGYAVVAEPIIAAWQLFMRGDHAGGLARLDPAQFQGFARAYIAEQRAHMLAADGQWQAAAKAYDELKSGTGPGISFLRVGRADALAMAGDVVAARAELQGDDATSRAALARLNAGKRIGPLAPDARRGVAWLLARLAGDVARERPVPLALLLARSASFTAPDLAATWLICGDILARGGQRSAALDAYGHIPVDDALFRLARARRVEVLDALGRSDEAGALLAAATSAKDAIVEDWLLLGQWHQRAGRFKAAAAAFGQAIALAGTGPSRDVLGDDRSWSLYFQRGAMWEQAGDWPAAVADLREAARRAPEEAMVLNYLGYSLLDRGEQPDEARRLIEKAAALRPGDGGIVDSLGWSQFRAGRFDDAVTTLERAWALTQDDPTVTDHLGDALWRVGRRIEARFRWRQALVLEPDTALKRQIDAKLDIGLDAALAMAEPPPR